MFKVEQNPNVSFQRRNTEEASPPRNMSKLLFFRILGALAGMPAMKKAMLNKELGKVSYSQQAPFHCCFCVDTDYANRGRCGAALRHHSAWKTGLWNV